MRKLLCLLLYFILFPLVKIDYVLADIHRVNPGPPPACNNAAHHHISTALGCLSTDPAILASDIIKIAIGISGGLAFLFLISGSFKLITSGGDPDNIQAAKERITSAIAGLLLIVFSVVILQIIGVNILRLPGFGPTTAPDGNIEVPSL